ncbi:MAG: transketolase [Rickettsiales bacterium]|nr:transketolase [Rickettsiales bacterium]RPG12570.1 MAG: transketolase [Pelagibacteraceae bacterium TMED195]
MSRVNDLKSMSNAIRALSIDAIERANSGHPGMPMGMADVATVLFSKFLKYDPSMPKWINRDRFILSAGHGSMLLYALSYLTGYKDCNLNQIKNFRQLGSKTAGHPEFGLLKSIETTTGPLGQGLANAVGMAIAEKILNKKYGKIYDHNTWVIAGDGCLMEGISHEAISIAGHLNLNKLIVIFDDNKISIDGPTSLTCSDDQKKRFEACNWKTIEINGHDFKSIEHGLKLSLNSKKPTLIISNSIIGYGSPNKSGKETSHGSPLGSQEASLTKQKLNWPYNKFEIPKEIKDKWVNIGKKGTNKRIIWEKKYKGKKVFKELISQFKSIQFKRDNKTLDFLKSLSKDKNAEATRKSSQKCLEFFSNKIPNFLGGSADLTSSNLTKMSNSKINGKSTNYIHYGVREHLMAAAMNGIAVHGGFLPYGGTFLVFSDYCKNAIRLSAMMKQQVIYVFTHDSIGLGEDGPTHQPIEHLASLRSIPNLFVIRPCDSIETFEAWEFAIKNTNSPTALILSRQNLPLIRNDFKENKLKRGAYFLRQFNDGKFSIISTGSEVSLALKVHDFFVSKKIKSNVVSMPSMELFNKQSSSYQDKILGNKPKVIIEAASSFGWHKYINKNDLLVSIDNFGESGKGDDLFDFFGFNCNNIVHLIKKKILT